MMKKIFYIPLIILTVFAVSCEKENVEPKNQGDNEQECSCSDSYGKKSSNCSKENNTIVDPITDPNNDEDENKPKRRRLSDSNS